MSDRVGWRPLFAVAVALLLCGAASGQLDTNLGGLDETNAEGYLQPLPSALSSSLGSGTFRTGDIPLEGFHFSIGVQAMSVGFDTEDRTYYPTDPPGFISVERKKVPTVVGSTGSVRIEGEGGSVRDYPGGFDLEYLVVGAPELRIGSVKGTRALVRWIAIDLGDADVGSLKMFGIGAEHSLSQYFADLPVQVAGGVLYQNFSIGDVLDSKFFQLRLTGSKTFPPIEPYLGLGFDSYGLKGEYTYKGESGDEQVKIEFDQENSFHLVVGVNLKFYGFALNSEYNLAAKSGVTIGLGFGR